MNDGATTPGNHDGMGIVPERRVGRSTSGTGKRHGYIFEVAADVGNAAGNATPLIDMGRFSHEASATSTPPPARGT